MIDLLSVIAVGIAAGGARLDWNSPVGTRRFLAAFNAAVALGLLCKTLL